MSTDLALLEKRAALKREILANRDKILPTLVLNKIDLVIRKIIHRKTPLPWFFCAVVLALICILPTLFARWLLEETASWKVVGIAEAMAVELGVVGFVAFHFALGFIIKNIDGFLIEAIESIDDLNDLQQWLESGWTLQKPIGIAIGVAIAWPLISTSWLSLAFGMFIGIGFIIAAIFVGGILGIALYYLVWIIKLPLHLGGYKYKLHEVDPVHSEVIGHLTHMLSGFIYSVAAYFALITMADVLTGGPAAQVVVIILALGWSIITTQFIVNQRALGKIVSTIKWKTLNEIQSEIRVLRTSGKLTEKETTDAINRLMDLHERIRNTQSSPLDLKAGLNFLNQLMLPLLGFMLANLDKILKFFTR
ncbi:hypothetical protein ANAEL_05567 [Anaerolineales bacterium]|nr:hypothetical protein ANAEL_05567 [Anaerolineales bacterium]